jgi:predicted transcriptional regulator
MPSPKGTSSILLRETTKARLDSLKMHPRETYNDVINRLIEYAEDSEPLSDATIQAIEEGLLDLRAGRVFTRDEVMRKLGVE